MTTTPTPRRTRLKRAGILAGALALFGGGAIVATVTAPEPVAVTAVVAAVVPVTTASTTTATGGNTACAADIATYCPGYVNAAGNLKADCSAAPSFNTGTAEKPNPSCKILLVACLADHQAQLSPACAADQAAHGDLNAAVNEACAIDTSKFCADVVPIPGKAPRDECLAEHRSELSATCGAAFDAQQAAKLVPTTGAVPTP